ncbi:MAG: adenylosuccinate synthetase, partial [Candidatus Omnitrophica bacterium]|nr:adenylosuccinate synthetase [Candidatus Omnitrophota bacterium]
ELAVMKLDVLDDLKEIKICTSYTFKGKEIRDFPHDYEIVSCAKPVYKSFPGWQASTRGIRSFQKLPVNAQKYINSLQDILKVKIKYVSIGSKRDEIIVR